MPTTPSSPRALLSSSSHPSSSAGSSSHHVGSHSAIAMPSTSPSAHPHAPTHRGSYVPHDGPSQRERQKQQDIDSAIGFTRARSASITAGFSPPSSPVYQGTSHSPDVLRRPSAPPRLSHHSSSHRDRAEDTPQFPMLSESEEADMSFARGGGGGGRRGAGYGTDDEDVILEGDEERAFALDGEGAHSPRSSAAHRSPEPSRSYEDTTLGALRASPGMLNGAEASSRAGSVRRLDLGGFSARNRFQFDLLEEFAQVEKVQLGSAELTPRYEVDRQEAAVLNEPYRDEEARLVDDRTSVDLPRSSVGEPPAESNRPPSPSGTSAAGDPTPTQQPSSPAQTAHANFVRRRQRKLSSSNPMPNARRQAKVALFEGGGSATAPSSFPFNAALGVGKPTSTAPLQPNVRDSKSSLYDTFTAPPPPGLQPPLMPSLQDRPYRFSFYSNALPSTIHARSLSELPAEGQTFEDLFAGRSSEDSADSMTRDDSSPVGAAATARTSGTATPRSFDGSAARESLLSKAMGLSKLSDGKTGGTPTSTAAAAAAAVLGRQDDPEATTWWLDVLCPTDEEMKTLSKVFGIHPLTTEDIQMEEAREKIELFRNYYLVCFRSFDQDPYSPTHLEPLNMYIIVFREGTLSFHFRGTPHPQNVRRRIKQLKDYISVTSDWISYALIDDIADAFGPLVQSIEYEVDSIDELVLILKEAEQSDMLRRIGTCRKKVMGLLRLMGNKADVVKGLAKRCNESWSVAPKSDIGLYLSDIQDHLITMTQNLNHYEKILSRSHSNYLAQISIDMTDANNQMNEVLSRMTALGTVLIPMNLVTGLWGMNVTVPGEGVPGFGWFFGIVGCLLAFALAGAFATYRFLKL